METCGISVNQAESCLRNLTGLAEQRDDPGAADVTDHFSLLAEFLALCADSLTAEPKPGDERYSAEFYRVRDVFVRAGFEALTARPWQSGHDWLQFGIRPREGAVPQGELSRQIADVARRLLKASIIDNFFFMNKPPGMRLRFQAATPESVATLADILNSEVTRWRAAGLIDLTQPGVYEPESQLFGGPRSMPFVHALFTVDSLIWLDYHAVHAIHREEVSPAWLVSLAVLRSVFAGLDIRGWEDIGVWDRVRHVAGRRWAGDEASLSLYPGVAAELRDLWSQGDQIAIASALDPVVREIVDVHTSALFTGAARWRSGYFCQRAASLGPRAAAAFYVIFHWNRAAIPLMEQTLLAESLAERVLENVRG